MAWTTPLYYIVLPFLYLTNLILLTLSPILHLLHYALHALFVPVRLLGKFETLYIYLGIAALIGLFTGLILYLCSSFFIVIFDLGGGGGASSKSEKAAIKPHSEEQKSESQQNYLTPPTSAGLGRLDDFSGQSHGDWIETDSGKPGLLSQTILEEFDDSDEF